MYVDSEIGLRVMTLRISSIILCFVWAASARAEGARCADGALTLDRAAAKTAIPGSNRVLAVIECAASDAAENESVLALFAGETTPVCHAPLNLTDDSGNFFLGKIKSMESRPLADGSHVAAISLGGGEANLFWTSQAFIRIDDKCGVTQLAKFYSRMHYDEDDGSKCEGAKHTYKFLDGAKIELRRENVHCTPTKEVVTVETKTFDLDAMLREPSRRVIEP